MNTRRKLNFCDFYIFATEGFVWDSANLHTTLDLNIIAVATFWIWLGRLEVSQRLGIWFILNNLLDMYILDLFLNLVLKINRQNSNRF